MSHSARGDLLALADRARNGSVEALTGPHSYDPATASEFRQAAVLALFTPTAQRTSAEQVSVDQPLPRGTASVDPADESLRSGDTSDGATRGEQTPSSSVRPQDTDVFLVQRSPLLRHHPGQIALPGGSIDPGDDGPVAAALRETEEETGIGADQVEVLCALPPVLVPISSFVVTPVLAWAPSVRPAQVLETSEVLHTLRAPVDQLLDPAARATVWMGGHGSSGFRVPTGWVWGFTGNLLDHLFTELGWTQDWDTSVRHPMSWDEARGAQLLGHVPSPD